MGRVLLGVDVGGTKISGVVLDERGAEVTSAWADHDARGLDDVARLIADLANRLLAEASPAEPATFGISVAGLVGDDGRVIREGALSLARDDVASAVADRGGPHGFLVNDAEATLVAALAADSQGSDVGHAVLFTLGTGVGGAIWSNHALLRGRHGIAGELGHIPVLQPLAYRCVCGGQGCLEQFASGRGLAERARAEAAVGSARDLVDFSATASGRLTSHHVVKAASRGVASAVRLLDDASNAMAQAITAVSLVVEPSKVYVGGSLGHAAAHLLMPRLEHSLHHRWPFLSSWPPPVVALDAVGRHAAAVGAALVARDQRASIAHLH